jgi:proteic killer suppression protein
LIYSSGNYRPDALNLSVPERRLDRLDQATTLADLAGLPSNRLERLRGDRKGQHSIRINDQWRICFIWEDDGPHAVEIVDYH